MHINFLRLRLYPAAILLSTLLGSIVSPVFAADGKTPTAPYQQDFLVTAYYSPVEGQYAYYRGTYDAEITFNGSGVRGADGTKVYEGMLAAPTTYAFGTRIKLPGVGVGTVHDRGGRIIEWTAGNQGTDLHRIDLWMGTGEEGLARSLLWGARRMHGTVYPAGTAQPEESIALSTLPAPTSLLVLLPQSPDASSYLGATFGEKKYAVKLLQQALASLGYLSTQITDQFGEQTRAALKHLQTDIGMADADGSSVDEQTYASLQIATSLEATAGPAIQRGLRRGSRGQAVKELQRTLRYLGFYRGRTDGVYGKPLIDAVMAFQKEHLLITTDEDVGAGTIGTRTQPAIVQAWRMAQIKQRTAVLLLKMQIADSISKILPDQTLAKGDSGTDVTQLQRLLSELGFFPQDQIQTRAHFGDLTRQSLIAYQLSKKIIASNQDHGAGNFGPATRQILLDDIVKQAWKVTRAQGVEAAL